MAAPLTRAPTLDAVVVGAGQSGVATSFFLGRLGVRHVVLERERAFAVWYDRWDSLRMNTPNWMNRLPGADGDFLPGAPPSGFGTRLDAIAYFERYLRSVDPPLREHVEVTRVRPEAGGAWRVESADAAWTARNVVVCTGQLARPKVPPLAQDLEPGHFHIHSSAYRRPEQLPRGDALVVGSGSSGVQICEDLARSGRFGRLKLSVSGNATFPWKILGIPAHSIQHALGVNRIPASWLGSRLRDALRERGDVATPPTPRTLHRRYGVELLGRVTSLSDGQVRSEDGSATPLEGLAIVWATGFAPDFGFVESAERERAFDARGDPIHERGASSAAPGLFFVGLRFQTRVVSHLVYGVGDDAREVAERVADRSRA